MMKTIIIYESSHHENTKKLVDAISKRHEITAVPVTQASDLDLRAYDAVSYTHLFANKAGRGMFFHRESG